MTPYDTHLCLVSAQATPNLLPLLDDAWRPKKVVLACSAQMKGAAQALRAVIQTKATGMVVETLELPNAYDYAALSDSFLSYLAEHESDNIALNVTGGTKLMAVAAQEAFRLAGKPVFYVNVETDEVLVIGQQATGHAPQPLRAKLKVHEMLRAHGYSVTTQEQPQITRELRDLTARLVDRVSSAGRALGALNALARAARDNNLRVELNRDQSSLALGDIVALFADAGLLRQQGDMLIFKDEEARFFANGGWLEAHVYEALQSLRAQFEGLTDVAMGVRVAFGGQDPRSGGKAKDKNEIDVAFLYRNTLHLIECKTANLAQGGKGDDNKATEALYKMESLLKLGGLRTRGMVVDYRGQLASSEADRQRAKESHIEIVAGAQLKDLKGVISRLWLSASKT
jgi:hypothetical protein